MMVVVADKDMNGRITPDGETLHGYMGADWVSLK
jgi:hypothetical protein